MSAAPGWYPDPGGGAGLYRYWDGRAWSAAVSPTPGVAPPPPLGSSNPAVLSGSAEGAGPGAVRRSPVPPVPGRPGASRVTAWMVALIAVLAALVVVLVLAVPRLAGGGRSTAPGGQPSTEVCPQLDEGEPEPQPGDGRVHAGRLSYAQLPPPWSPPAPQEGVAFGKGVLIQSVEIERGMNQAWLAAVLLGELVAGDGFFSPAAGAGIVVRCVSGTFYGASAVSRDDQRNEALRVDGHDGWVIESQLAFDVPGIQAKSERLIVVVVDTGAASAGLFYASVPENAPHLLAPARQALAGLRVEE